MDTYSLSHLAEGTLEFDLKDRAVRERTVTAEFLAHIAEFDARRSYLPKAYPSMVAYCVQELGMCEQAALKRIRVARAALRFPVIFHAVAGGRLHLASVLLLTPHLNPENANELLAAAERKSRSEVEKLLAQRFPRPELTAGVHALPVPGSVDATRSPGTVGNGADGTLDSTAEDLPLSPGTVWRQPTGPVSFPASKLTPLTAELYALQVTIGRTTHDWLVRAQELLSHRVSPGDLAQVLDRALEGLVTQLEKRKFAATAQPRKAGPTNGKGRSIPAHVKRTVRERDGDQCAFVGGDGRRCTSRSRLEFDHMDAVARGGQASVDRVRLLCRAHNQYAAECTFGKEFMRRRRESEIAARAEAKKRKAGHPFVPAATHVPADARVESFPATKELPADRPAHSAPASGAATLSPGTVRGDNDIIPWLRRLGYRAREAQQGAAACAHIPEAPLEQRLKVALASFPPKGTRTGGRSSWTMDFRAGAPA